MGQWDCFREIKHQGTRFGVFSLAELHRQGWIDLPRLPYSIRVLAENVMRKQGVSSVGDEALDAIRNWRPHVPRPVEIPFFPGRVLMQDFTGVPALVDLAAMRDALGARGGDPRLVNPSVPVDLVIDHSVQVDFCAAPGALERNVALEYARNRERYVFLKWAQANFANFRVVPPNSGICHQVNLEILSQGIVRRAEGGRWIAMPDTLVGTDSHTTMVNGLGVLGWGVGGIEAEAVMLGQPYVMPLPEVVGVRLVGELPDGVTATDLVLTLTARLRQHGVVEKFVEFFGPGLDGLGVPDRATVANMAPEYGATVGYFPIDRQVLDYLAATGREAEAVFVEAMAQGIGIFRDAGQEPDYTETIDVDLGAVRPCLAGPTRPQDVVELPGMPASFSSFAGARTGREARLVLDGREFSLRDGSIVIAAITSCTNTSNPEVLVAAGLLAKNAVRRGLSVPAHVKTSFAPGSRVVPEYLRRSGLLEAYESLGFHVAGYGCTTCIGNSGPLHPAIDQAIAAHDLTVAAVLSGNRNFEARIHQKVKANYLASPPLVVAFALAGRVDLDLEAEPLGTGADGSPVFLRDLWPSGAEIAAIIQGCHDPELYRESAERIFAGDASWDSLAVPEGSAFAWDEASTYIRKPPYFDGLALDVVPPADIGPARALALLGDMVTTDHISPAGAIPDWSPAGRYLIDHRVDPADFNSYGSRRGNHEVMVRGTFGNVRLRNALAASKIGGYTRKLPEGEICSIHEASERYAASGVGLIVIAGAAYGTGSSRDWAAKGTALLGVKAVLAGSFERIHRANLVGMGILPLAFEGGATWQGLGLDGTELYHVSGIDGMTPGKILEVRANRPDGTEVLFRVRARLDTPAEVACYQNGGIWAAVLRRLA